MIGINKANPIILGQSLHIDINYSINYRVVFLIRAILIIMTHY